MGFQKMVWAGFLLGVLTCGVTATDNADNPSVQLFQQYIRMNTTSNSDLTQAVNFWKDLAQKYQLPVQVLEIQKGMPIVIITWQGTDDSLPRIMLNSHMDTVPADPSEWLYDPFSAYIDENGEIYGRGTQDMKSVSIQYFEALRRVTKDNTVQLKRTIYMTLMPDEEIGGEYGMQTLIASDLFKTMNIEFEMDEGGPFPIPVIPIFYQDKTPWHVQFDCYGEGGHGSTFPAAQTTATGQCKYIMDKLLSYREQQYAISTTAAINDAGSFTSVNLNKLSGGTANNIIPSHVSLVFDIRLGTNIKEDDFDNQLHQWAEEAGPDVRITYLLKNKQSPATAVDDSNPYWLAILNGVHDAGHSLLPAIPPGSTDARFIRSDTIAAFGFSPMPNTELLMHMANERLNVATFLQGIDIYEKIITNLGNLP